MMGDLLLNIMYVSESCLAEMLKDVQSFEFSKSVGVFNKTVGRERAATYGHVFLTRIELKFGKSSTSVRRLIVLHLRSSTACDTARILSSQPSSRQATSSGILVGS